MGQAFDVSGWHELQEWLEVNCAFVDVPYLVTLAESVPPVAVRLRRDFPSIAPLIRAHALLHQASRERNPVGAIVATLDDYAKVREIVADLVAEAADQTVPDTLRETVDAVDLLTTQSATETTVVAVAKQLGLDKSAASRRVRVALDRGYIRNLEDRRGRPLRLVLGEALPSKQQILPEPDELARLHGCTDDWADTSHLSSEPEYVQYSAPGSWLEAPSDYWGEA